MGMLRSNGLMFLLVACLALASGRAGAADLISTLSTSSEVHTNGERVEIWLNLLNPGSASMEHTIVTNLSVVAVWENKRVAFKLALGAGATNRMLAVAPGSFARVPYELIVPEHIDGILQVMLTNPPNSAVSLTILPPSKPMFTSVPAPKEKDDKEVPQRPRIPFDADDYFRRHFYGYDPVYFIAGPVTPTAKFQFSLRYQVLDADDAGLGWIAQRLSYATNVFFAYSQVALWDLAAPSAPFLDTSYKPEIHYWWRNVFGQTNDAHWFHMDLQGGYQHESNGKNPPDSKSINLLYLQPTLFFGDRNRFHLSLGARAWVYIFDVDDNPDIADYRGHFDVRAKLGWPDHVQLSAFVRAGDSFDHGSATVDLSYPLFGAAGRGLSLYLHAQYFTGYGETLLEYNRRSDAVRFGFSIYR